MEKNNKAMVFGALAVLAIAAVYLMVSKDSVNYNTESVDNSDSALQGEMVEAGEEMMATEEFPPVDEAMMTEESAMSNEVAEPNYMEPQPPVALTEAQVAQLQAGAEDHEVKELVFDVSGGSFYFVPNEIRVKEGDQVKIVFTNVGGTHDLVLPDFGVATKVTKTGETDTIEFTANKKGSYEFYCSVGNGYHRQMGQIGTLFVE